MRGLVARIVGRIGSRAVAVLAQAVLYLLIARSLGPSDFGILVQVIAIGTFGAAVLGFGFRVKGLQVREYSKPFSVASAIVLIRLLTAAFLGVGLVLAFHVILGQPVVLVLTGAIVVTSEHVVEAVQSVAAGLGMQATSSIMTLLYRLPALVLCAVVPSTAALNIGSTIGVLASVGYFMRYWERPGCLLRAVRGCVGYWAATVIGSVSQLDSAIVRATLGFSTVGVYGVASRLAGPLNIVNASIVSAVLPDLSAIPEKESRLKIVISLLKISGLYTIFLLVFAPIAGLLLRHALGVAYAGVEIVVYGIFVSAALSGLSQVLHSALYSEGYSRRVAYSIGLGTLLYLSILWPFSKIYALWGVSVAMILGQLMILVSTVVFFAMASRRPEANPIWEEVRA